MRFERKASRNPVVGDRSPYEQQQQSVAIGGPVGHPLRGGARLHLIRTRSVGRPRWTYTTILRLTGNLTLEVRVR